ncbi:5-hydroxytryptamine (serotonin) receptor 2B [Carabus blaptoides fortunei]
MEVEVSTIRGNSTWYVENDQGHLNNWWALLALALVVATAGGNILVCLAITWERRLQNVTNYFLMSLAITDLMVAVLVMPLGILTLVRGEHQSVIMINYLCSEQAGHSSESIPNRFIVIIRVFVRSLEMTP